VRGGIIQTVRLRVYVRGDHPARGDRMSHLLRHHYGGWRHSKPNLYRPVADTSGIKVRAEVDPRGELPGVFNQWALGACTIHADIGAFMYEEILDGSKTAGTMLCRFQGYWLERQHEGDLGQGDTGAEGVDGFWAAKNRGLAPETAWPYAWPGQDQDAPPANNVFDPTTMPGNAQREEGFYRLAKPYAAVPQNEIAIKQAVSNKQTVSFGFTVYESFESAEVASTGIVPMPQQGEKILGGHQTLIVGYLKAEPNYALVRNSWGVGWGLKGYFLMPWSYITNGRLVSDLVTIQRPIGA
jgi:C1A family cysteine protease